MEIEETPYQVQDLIYAKIQNYPWWPAKVIGVYQQNKQLIFKVSFYGDLTYCYLTQSHILPYEDFKQQLNANFIMDNQLQNAVNLAKNAFQKKLHLVKKRKASKKATPSQQPYRVEMEEQVCQYNEKVFEFEQSTIHPQIQSDPPNNNSLCSKQIVSVQKLLSKYRLDFIPKLQTKKQRIESSALCNQQIDIISESESHDQDKEQLFNPKKKCFNGLKLKKIKRNVPIKRKKSSPLSKEQKKVQFMKTFCRQLIKKGFDSSVSRKITTKVMNRIQKTVITKYPLQELQYYKIYLKLLLGIANFEGSLDQDENMLQIFYNIDTVLEQADRTSLEENEKSRVTQMLVLSSFKAQL